MESTIEALRLADAALPGLNGINDEDQGRLVAALMAGLDWGAATAAVFSGRPSKLAPRLDVLATWRPALERIAAAGGSEPVPPSADWRHGAVT